MQILVTGNPDNPHSGFGPALNGFANWRASELRLEIRLEGRATARLRKELVQIVRPGNSEVFLPFESEATKFVQVRGT